MARERASRSINLDGADEDLIVGNTYFVFSLERWSDSGLRVYLHTVEGSSFPYPYPIEMFDVVDPTFPSAWGVGLEEVESGLIIKRISFEQWAKDDFFYEKLIDDEPLETRIYKDICEIYSQN
ncbi:MAG: hypothetical protein WC997_15400 [Porticoccaceae bacterium]